MPNNPQLKIVLILVCVAIHIFNGTGLMYTHPYLSKNLFTFNNEAQKLLEISNRSSFLTYVLGGYFLGKIADRHGFIKTMKLICLAFFLASILITFFDKVDFLQRTILLCLAHSMHSFLRIGSFLIPAVYIFQHYKTIEIYKYSAFIWTAVFTGLAIINLCVVIFINAQHIDWCIAYLVSSATSFVIYSYLGNLPEPKKENVLKSPTRQSIFLGFLFAGICGSGLNYQFYVIESYVKDVMILETAGQYVIYSPFWITLFLMLIPTAQVAKNFGIKNTISISFIGMLSSVSLLFIFPLFNYNIFLVHQIIFAVFFSLLLSPSLAFIYQLLQGPNSYFCINFIFQMGFACFAGLTLYISTLSSLPAPFLGASIIALLMSVCLLLIYYRNPFVVEK